MTKTLELIHPRSLKYLAAQIGVLLEAKLWAKIVAGMLLGILTGTIISPQGFLSESLAPHSQLIETLINWLALPGKLFLKMVQMVIVPLILASIIKGLASANDMLQLRRLGLRFTLFVTVTSVLSALLAVVLGSTIRAGSGLNLGSLSQEQGVEGSWLSLKSLTLIYYSS